MRQLFTPVLLLVLGAACSKPAPPPAPKATDPAFDHAWTNLAQKGVDAFYIEDDRGEGLMGNVLRAQTGALAMAPNMQDSLRHPGGQALPVSPNPEEVQKAIRQYLGGVKSCYL